MYRFIMITTFIFCFTQLVSAEEARRDSLYYAPPYEDPVLKEMEDANEAAKEARQALTDSIVTTRQDETEKKEDEKKVLRLDYAPIQKPASPDDFHKAFHFPPIRQYNTGTCWSFSTTSYLESEIERLSGQQIKLSEMYTVYFEYLLKAQRYIQNRGESLFDEGSEGNAVMRVWREYGIVPMDAYPGELSEGCRYDHEEMLQEMLSYLEYVKTNNLWDEELNLASIRLILNKYMGPPPERFRFKGKDYTPLQFMTDVVKLNTGDYIEVMSTLAHPFGIFSC